MSTPSSVPALAGPAELQQFLRRRARWARWFFAVVAVIALGVAVVAGRGEPAALLSAGAFIVVMAFFTLLGKRRLNQTWRGEIAGMEVRQIRHRQDDDSAVRRVEHRHLLHVRTAAGAKHEIQVTPELYAGYFAVGQAVIKFPGLGVPLHARPEPGAPRVCAHCGVLLPADATTCPRCRCPLPDPARF